MSEKKRTIMTGAQKAKVALAAVKGNKTVNEIAQDLITYQFRKTIRKLGKGRLFCKQRFKYRSPRVNQDTILRWSFLKLQCLGSICSFVFFPGVWDGAGRHLDRYGRTKVGSIAQREP